MGQRKILDTVQCNLTLQRLCYQLIENHNHFNNSVIIGLQPRGVALARQLYDKICEVIGCKFPYGELDTTFFRDDFKLKPLVPQSTSIDFEVDNKSVILIDDVLYTGRSVRSALDALTHFGRPSSVELLVLIDRRFSRHLPIQPDYVGVTVDAVNNEKVIVDWQNTGQSAEVYLTTIL
jgi:pyrimidine operon attenuation protein / uracil phosphoribosyltransferase